MISINNDSSVPQPMELLEEYLQPQTDNESINKSLQRNRIVQGLADPRGKRQATLNYTMMAPSDYQNLLGKFTTGSGVYYSNNLSNKPGGIFAFSGLPYFNESPYLPGASLYAPFSVRIREQ